MMIAVASSAANAPTSTATYPLGVQWYCPFDPATPTKMQNCMTFKRICTGASDAV